MSKKSKNPEDLDLFEFNKILDCTVEELLERAWKEKWQVKHIDFWLRIKNAQNFEAIKLWIEDIKTHLEDISEDRPVPARIIKDLLTSDEFQFIQVLIKTQRFNPDPVLKELKEKSSVEEEVKV